MMNLRPHSAAVYAFFTRTSTRTSTHHSVTHAHALSNSANASARARQAHGMHTTPRGKGPAIKNRHVSSLERRGDGRQRRYKRVLLLLLSHLSARPYVLMLLLSSPFSEDTYARTSAHDAIYTRRRIHTHACTRATLARAIQQRYERHLAEVPEQMRIWGVRARNKCRMSHIVFHILEGNEEGVEGRHDCVGELRAWQDDCSRTSTRAHTRVQEVSLNLDLRMPRAPAFCLRCLKGTKPP